MGKTVTLLASALSVLLFSVTGLLNAKTEAESMPELTITSPFVHSRDFGFSLWILHEAKQLNVQDMHTPYSMRG
jgi:hypothetical protein